MLIADMTTKELLEIQSELEWSIFQEECYSTGDQLEFLAVSRELERREQK